MFRLFGRTSNANMTHWRTSALSFALRFALLLACCLGEAGVCRWVLDTEKSHWFESEFPSQRGALRCGIIGPLRGAGLFGKFVDGRLDKFDYETQFGDFNNTADDLAIAEIQQNQRKLRNRQLLVDPRQQIDEKERKAWEKLDEGLEIRAGAVNTSRPAAGDSIREHVKQVGSTPCGKVLHIFPCCGSCLGHASPYRVSGKMKSIAKDSTMPL